MKKRPGRPLFPDPDVSYPGINLLRGIVTIGASFFATSQCGTMLLYFCVVHAPFGHIQNRAKIVVEYTNRSISLSRKLIESQAEWIPGALASVADLRHH